MKITLPDESIKELPKGVTGLDVAESIGPGLAKSAIAVSIDGIQKDLSDPINSDCSLSVITLDSEMLSILSLLKFLHLQSIFILMLSWQ